MRPLSHSLLTRTSFRVEYTVDGKPWFDKLKNEDFKDEIPEFKRILAKIGEKHGWTLEDLKARFSNELFDRLVFDDVEKKEANGKVGLDGGK